MVGFGLVRLKSFYNTFRSFLVFCGEFWSNVVVFCLTCFWSDMLYFELDYFQLFLVVVDQFWSDLVILGLVGCRLFLVLVKPCKETMRFG